MWLASDVVLSGLQFRVRSVRVGMPRSPFIRVSAFPGSLWPRASEEPRILSLRAREPVTLALLIPGVLSQTPSASEQLLLLASAIRVSAPLWQAGCYHLRDPVRRPAARARTRTLASSPAGYLQVVRRRLRVTLFVAPSVRVSMSFTPSRALSRVCPSTLMLRRARSPYPGSP